MFSDQIDRPLEIEENINVTLIVNWSVTYKNEILFQLSNT